MVLLHTLEAPSGKDRVTMQVYRCKHIAKLYFDAFFEKRFKPCVTFSRLSNFPVQFRMFCCFKVCGLNTLHRKYTLGHVSVDVFCSIRFQETG